MSVEEAEIVGLNLPMDAFSHHVWSPDGQWLAFLPGAEERFRSLVILDMSDTTAGDISLILEEWATELAIFVDPFVTWIGNDRLMF